MKKKKLKVGDRVKVYGPCTALDWHHGDTRVVFDSGENYDEDGVELRSTVLSGDVCTVHRIQCVRLVKKSKKKKAKTK